ncbi:MAG: repressor LexA, partial [Geobacteraceae bacterium]
MDTLTPTQRRLMDYLQRKIAADGRVPSLREAASHLKVSHAAVARTLRVLES